MSKGFIKDEVIESIMLHYVEENGGWEEKLNKHKEKLKSKGYEVEEKKTALEEARENASYVINTCVLDNAKITNLFNAIEKSYECYEKVIEEIQQKNKCSDCFYSSDGFICNYHERTGMNCNKKSGFKQKLVINERYIEWLKLMCNNQIERTLSDRENARKLLKELNIGV